MEAPSPYFPRFALLKFCIQDFKVSFLRASSDSSSSDLLSFYSLFQLQYSFQGFRLIWFLFNPISSFFSFLSTLVTASSSNPLFPNLKPHFPMLHRFSCLSSLFLLIFSGHNFCHSCVAETSSVLFWPYNFLLFGLCKSSTGWTLQWT